MKPDEVRSLPPAYLRLIVLIEARAKPRLRTVEGLWRSPIAGKRGNEPRPGAMTDFIRDAGLLPAAEIEHIIRTAPFELLSFQVAAARVDLAERPPISAWIERFNAGLDSMADDFRLAA